MGERGGDRKEIERGGGGGGERERERERGERERERERIVQCILRESALSDMHLYDQGANA